MAGATVSYVLKFGFTNVSESGSLGRVARCKECRKPIKDKGKTMSNFIRHLRVYPQGY